MSGSNKKRPRGDAERPKVDSPGGRNQKRRRLFSQNGSNSKDMSSLFNQPSLSDCKLIIIRDNSSSYSSEPPKRLQRSSSKSSGQTEEKVELWVSRAILSIPDNGHYFKKLFSSSANKDSAVKEVEIRVDAELKYFVDLVQYLYTSQFETPQEELMEVWKIAERFGVFPVLKAIATTLADSDSLEFAAKLLSVPRFSELPAYPEMKSKAVGNILADLGSFSQKSSFANEKFTSLSFAAVSAVLDDDELVVASENDVFSAAVYWLEANKATVSKTAARELLELVRTPYATRSFLQTLYPTVLARLFKQSIIDNETYAMMLRRRDLVILVGDKIDRQQLEPDLWRVQCGRSELKNVLLPRSGMDFQLWNTHDFEFEASDLSKWKDVSLLSGKKYRKSRAYLFYCNGFEFTAKFAVEFRDIYEDDDGIETEQNASIDFLHAYSRKSTLGEVRDANGNIKVRLRCQTTTEEWELLPF